MLAPTLLLFIFSVLCTALVQPAPVPEELLSDAVKERLGLVKNNAVQSIWDSDKVSNCYRKRPSDSKLHDKYFLSFSFEHYLCLILHDISLHFLNVSSNFPEVNSGLIHENAEKILNESPHPKDFCQRMKDIVLPPEIDEKSEWVTFFMELMKKPSECKSHCIAEVGVNPLCAFILWVSNASNFIEHGLRQTAAIKGTVNGGAPANLVNRPDVNLLSASGAGTGPLKKNSPSVGQALPLVDRVPAISGPEGGNTPGKVSGNGFLNVNTVLTSDATGSDATALGASKPSILQQMPKGSNTPHVTAINNEGSAPGSPPVYMEPPEGDVDEGGGRGAEAGDEGADQPIAVDGEGGPAFGESDPNVLDEEKDQQHETDLSHLNHLGSTGKEVKTEGVPSDQQLPPKLPSKIGENQDEHAELKPPEHLSPAVDSKPVVESKVNQPPAPSAPEKSDQKKQPPQQPSQETLLQTQEEQPEDDVPQPPVAAEGTPSATPGTPQKAAKKPEKIPPVPTENEEDLDDLDLDSAMPEENEAPAAAAHPKGPKDNPISSPRDGDYQADRELDFTGGNALNTDQKATQEEADTHLYAREPFPDAEDSHFFAYFMTMMILCIIGYLIFHNKQKILALALEGRSRRGSRRRPNTSGYRKLDSNLEEAVTSGCSSASVTHVIY